MMSDADPLTTNVPHLGAGYTIPYPFLAELRGNRSDRCEPYGTIVGTMMSPLLAPPCATAFAGFTRIAQWFIGECEERMPPSQPRLQ